MYMVVCLHSFRTTYMRMQYALAKHTTYMHPPHPPPARIYIMKHNVLTIKLKHFHAATCI